MIDESKITFDVFNEIFTLGFDEGFEEKTAQEKRESEGCNLNVLIFRQYEKYIASKTNKQP